MPGPGQLVFGEGVGIGVESPLLKAVAAVNPTLTFASIAANNSAEVTTTVTGARVGDGVLVNPSTNLGSVHLTYAARVSANDTVAVKVTNPTVGALDPSDVAWRIIVFRYSV